MDQAQQLRNVIKLKNQKPAKTARVVTITSGKGGVGKSNLAVNLAVQLRKQGKSVIIFDADFGMANVEVMYGVIPQYTLSDLIYKGKSIREIISKGPMDIGFISGGSGIQELTRLTREQIIYLTQKLFQLDKLADIIIIDTGAGIADSVLEFVAASSEVILVATPEPTSITDAYALLKTLNRKSEFSVSNTNISMLANRITSEEDGKELYEKLRVVTDKFLQIPLTYLGGIPQDNNVSKAVIQQKPVTQMYPNSEASKALIRIAEKICNGSDVVVHEKKGMAQLFSNLIKSKYRKK